MNFAVSSFEQGKPGLRDGAVLNAHPEFEDCRRVAEAAGVPVKQVVAAALVALGLPS
ncbi:hypothetical protein MFUL124B02_38665 [Myxococcus fulvus 124B02]|nr:hypothetical protein MFUL124B02_38665 [Myxococcus fulvus 124B02]